MQEPGLDNWCWRMKEHKRKGHHIIKYPEMDGKRNVDEIEQDLILKNQRVAFWEEHHSIPTINDLMWWEREVET